MDSKSLSKNIISNDRSFVIHDFLGKNIKIFGLLRVSLDYIDYVIDLNYRQRQAM